MRKFAIWLSVLVLFGSSANAGFDYSIEAADSLDPTTLGNTVFDFSNPGTGTLRMYLVQRPNGADVPTAFNSLGANFTLAQVDGSAMLTPTRSGLFSNGGNPVLDAGPPPSVRYRNFAFAPVNSSLINGFHAVELGTLAASTPGLGVTFNILDPSTGDDIDINGATADAAVFARSASFSVVVAIPEPGSFGLIGLAVFAVVSRRKRGA